MIINSYMPVQIISGKGCLKENSGLLKDIGKSCLIITGGNSAKKRNNALARRSFAGYTGY